MAEPSSTAYEPMHGKPLSLERLPTYQKDSIVSTRILQKPAGSVTFFSFHEGQELSEHTAPFDALLQVVDGEAEIMVGGSWHRVPAGSAILLPGGVPHAVKAVQRFKMLLVMIRS